MKGIVISLETEEIVPASLVIIKKMRQSPLLGTVQMHIMVVMSTEMLKSRSLQSLLSSPAAKKLVSLAHVTYQHLVLVLLE